MGGTFLATARFQDSEFFSESYENGVGMHFECDLFTFPDSDFNPVLPTWSTAEFIV